MTKPTRVDYCQYLLSTPLNYTLTHFADHSETFSFHDQINRYLANDRDSLHWTASEQTSGKRVKLHKFPKHHKVKVFRVVSSRRTDYVITNDLSQSDISATQQACGSALED